MRSSLLLRIADFEVTPGLVFGKEIGGCLADELVAAIPEQLLPGLVQPNEPKLFRLLQKHHVGEQIDADRVVLDEHVTDQTDVEVYVCTICPKMKVRITVIDPSGAVIVGAQVTIRPGVDGAAPVTIESGGRGDAKDEAGRRVMARAARN